MINEDNTDEEEEDVVEVNSRDFMAAL